MNHDLIQTIIEKNGTAVGFVDGVLGYAFSHNVSDVHIDPFSDGILIRMRIDGVLEHIGTFSQHLYSEIVARIKVMARLRTDIHAQPQDGRFKAGSCEVRVSCMPSHYGQSIVLRLLATRNEPLSFVDLGLSESMRLMLEAALTRHRGMIIVTGPTGSGKTTTLYSILARLNDSAKALVTLEDPVEYTLRGVRHVPIHPQSGLTFAHGLRAVLRQDPDVVMVGEMRDAETANIAINAALTGHMVITSLHTNSALGVFPRLIDMGVDPYLINSTITCVVAQRLVRTYCSQCRGKGCNECRSSGYKGRMGIYEVIPHTVEFHDLVRMKSDVSELSKVATAQNIKTIYQDAQEKVEQGHTSIEEIRRVLSE